VAFGIAMTIFTSLLALPILSALEQVTQSAKNTVVNNIIGGTLGIASLALGFLGYSLSQRAKNFGEKSSRIYSKVAMIMYSVIPLCVFDALVSVAYILTESSCLHSAYQWLFDLSLLFLFIIGGLLILSTTYLIVEEYRF
jgi:hypothetical protein